MAEQIKPTLSDHIKSIEEKLHQIALQLQADVANELLQ